MKNKKALTLILAAAVLAVLFGCWFFLRRKNDEAARESSVAAEGEEVFSTDTSKLTAISFKIGDEEYSFTKDGDSWKLDSDENFPVDEDKLLNAVSSLESLKSLKTITDVSDQSEYGLDDPQNTIRITDSDGTETEIVIGDTNSGTGNDYVSISGKEDVYTVDDSILSDLPEELTDVAVSDMFPSIDEEDITKFTAQTGDTTFELEKHDDTWSATKGSDFAIADTDSVEDFLQQDVTGLVFQDYVEYYCTDFSQYGLDDPYAVITVEYTEDDETKEFKFYVGGQDENSNYYVRFDGSQQVHTITESQINAIMSEEPSDLAQSETEATTELGSRADLVSETTTAADGTAASDTAASDTAAESAAAEESTAAGTTAAADGSSAAESSQGG